MSLIDEKKLNGGRMILKEDIRDGHADIMFAFCCRLMVADGGFRFEPRACASLLGNHRALSADVAKIGASKDEFALDKLADMCAAVSKLEQFLAMMRIATDALNYRCLGTAMHALSARRNGLIPSVEELGGGGGGASDAKNFGKVDVKKLYDVFNLPAGFEEPPFNEISELNELLDTHRVALKRVFRFYSAGTGAGAQVRRRTAWCECERVRDRFIHLLIRVFWMDGAFTLPLFILECEWRCLFTWFIVFTLLVRFQCR